MSFHPSVGGELVIDGLLYSIAEHPHAPGIPYGQEGRAAVVYQLIAREEKCALKVFKPRFQVPSLVSLSRQLEPFPGLPGLRVCERTVITPNREQALLAKYPDLLYGVVMPWVEGPTWMQVLLKKTALTPEKSLMLARSFADILSTMEQERLAHCDLSGPNLILPALSELSGNSEGDGSPIELVDVEQLYGPGLHRPDVVPSGSPGYAHRNPGTDIWSASADRFAGAILMAEMLCWCDPRIRDAAWGESYFDPAELQQKSPRYDLLASVLQEHWRMPIAHMLERAWASDTLSDCPTFGAWVVRLPLDASKPAISEGHAAIGHSSEVILATEVKPNITTYKPPIAVPAEAARSQPLESNSRNTTYPAPKLFPLLPPKVEGNMAVAPGKASQSTDQIPEAMRALQLYKDGMDAYHRGSLLQARQLLTTYVNGTATRDLSLRSEAERTLVLIEGLLSSHNHTATAAKALAPNRRKFITGLIVLASVLAVGAVVWMGLQPCKWLDVMIAHTGCIREITESAPGLTNMAFTLDDTSVLIAHENGMIEKRSVNDGSAMSVTWPHDSYVQSTYLATDAEVAAGLASRSTILVWRTSDGVIQDRMEIGSIVTPTCVVLSPEGKFLAMASEDGKIRLWKTTDAYPMTTIESGRNDIVALAFSHSDQTLAAGTSKGPFLYAWRIDTGSQVWRQDLQDQNSDAALEFSPNDKVIASSGWSTTRLLRASDGQVLQPLYNRSLEGGGFVGGLAFAPDGETLAVGIGANSGVARIWRVADGKLLSTLAGSSKEGGNSYWNVDVMFSHTGHVLATQWGSTVQLWKIP